MVDAEDLKMDNVPALDLDGEIIELTQIVDENKSFDDDIIELTEPLVDVEESGPVTGISAGNEDHISDAQISSVLEKIIEEKYGHRMDALFSDIIRKVVEKEMEIIKKSLLNALAEK
jgi:hypothetical protein